MFGTIVNDKENKLNYLLKSVDRMPALPQVVHKSLSLIEDQRSTAKSIAEIISLDPILTGRLLRIANSAFYGFPRKIKTVQDAIIVLGFDTIKSLIIAASVHKLFNKKIEGYGLQRGELWRHSVGCAMSCQMIAGKLNYDPEEAFVAGLLHDVGKVVLDQLMISEFQKIVEFVIQDNISFSRAEKMVLGFDHADIGSRIATKWNFPISLVEAIKFHHEPGQSKRSAKLASIVKIGDGICLLFGFGIGGDELEKSTNKEYLKILKLSEENLDQLVMEIGEAVSNNPLAV